MRRLRVNPLFPLTAEFKLPGQALLRGPVAQQLRSSVGSALQTGDRWLNHLAAEQADHPRHMRRVAILLGALVALLFLANLQWLRENTLQNSPSFDALVYQNESYDNYLLVRAEGIRAVFRKYTDGRQNVPPLHALSGTASYLLFGPDPANFYIAPAIWLFLLLLGTYGFVHYWTGQAVWAALAAALIVTINSVVDFGLRVSQTDFSVGAAFTWATYVLVASGGLRSRKMALVYGLSAGACALLKSSIVPYFLAHLFIWLVYLRVEPEQRMLRLQNSILAGAVLLGVAGWFYRYNFRQIIAYYTAWGGEFGDMARSMSGERNLFDEATYYLRSLAVFHLRITQAPLYALTMLVAMSAGALALLRRWGQMKDARIRFGLLLAIIWLVVPYTVLSIYRSKAYSVDYPFMATFFVIPALLAALAFRGRLLALGLLVFLPFLFIQVVKQEQTLVQSRPVGNWRERDVLTDIFADADRRGLQDVVISNAFVHQYLTSENLRFFVLNGTFAGWRDRFKHRPRGLYWESNGDYQFLLGTDYILAKTGGYIPPTHANNVVAPQFNAQFAADPSLSELKRYDLPDRTQLIVYRNETLSSVSYPPPTRDGWLTAHLPITIFGPPKDRMLLIQGRIPVPRGIEFPIELYLENEGGQQVTERASVLDEHLFEVSIRVPASVLSGGANGTNLYLMSSKPIRPLEFGLNDTRELMFRPGGIRVQDAQ